uniref:Retrotransposon Copia-like N-terminal domain-containing protein n=1 Tax=Vitis vinifera TaxID=29760 RepID=A5BVI9_VITVI|nr:hypothetical protein VITISV_005901 [Vitis vinifera]
MATKSSTFSVISGSPMITSEKLVGNENYLSWSTSVELWFMGQGYEDHLVTQEADIPEVDRVQWRKIDAQLCSVLWQSVDPKILLHLRAYKTCFKFWNQAKGLYDYYPKRSQESNASNRVRFGAEMRKIWPLEDNCSRLVVRVHKWLLNPKFYFKSLRITLNGQYMVSCNLCMPYWIRDQEGRLVRIENPQDTELDICVNIMDPPQEDQNSQHENEKFHECWERYMEAINACPHHGFDTWLLVSYFYDGMSSSMKQILETMCGGDFMSKNPEEAMDFLSYVSEVSRGWDEPNSREKGKFPSQPTQNPKGGMYVLSEDMDMKAKVATIARRLEELELKKMHEVQAISETQAHVMPCTICQSCDHVVDECPTMPAMREMLGDQANVVGQFRPNNNAPYGNTYNSN